MMNKKVKYKIGIDPGVKTGFAVWSEGKLQRVETLTITKAFDAVKEYPAGETRIFIEDPRKWVGYKGKATAATQARLQGAGSVKRDASIWEQWFIENGYEDIYWLKPRGNGQKTSLTDFLRITKWPKKRVSEHARDAAMFVYGRGY